MQIKFTQDCEVEGVVKGERKVVARFKAGEVKEMSSASARHWMNRNKAVLFQGAAKKADPTPEAAPAVEEKRGPGRPKKAASSSAPAPASDKPTSTTAGAKPS